MKKLIIVVLAVLTSACGTYGEPLWLARMYDSRDPCQLQNVRGNTMEEKFANMPSWCGASSSGNRQVVRTYYDNRPVYTIRNQ